MIRLRAVGTIAGLLDWFGAAGQRGGRLFVLSLTLGALTSAYAQDRPNILFLFADDQRADTIAAWGNEHIRTPNLDRLAGRGFSFRRNYCLGSNSGAVCVPSRAMVNSGRAYFRVPSDLAGVPLLSEILRDAGYATFATGKWHNGEESFLRAFDRAKTIFLGGMSDHTQVPLHDVAEPGRLTGERTGEGFSSEMFADAAVEFLTSFQGEEPFYAYVAFTAPHDPRQPPLPYREMYYKNPPPLPANFLPQHPFDNGSLIGRDENLGPWPRPREMIQDQLSEYYGLITHLDEQVGRILDALEKSGRAENTVIVYAADHGLAIGSHGLLGKQNIYEHSMRAPLIVAGPGIPQGQTEAFTYLLDIFPTVCNLARAEMPEGIDGHDLSPLWLGSAERVRPSLFLSYQNLMRAVLDGRWKLIRYPRINFTQLFDLESDPDEMHNLASDPDHKGRVGSLMALLTDWQQRFGDTQPLRVDDPLPLRVDLTGHERPPDRWQPDWIVEKYFGAAR